MSPLLTPTNLTPTEKRVWLLLKDGRVHSHEEMMSTLFDPLSSPVALAKVLTLMRRKIGFNGFDVVCRAGTYRLMRTIGGDDE